MGFYIIQIQNNNLYIHDAPNNRLLKCPIGASQASILINYQSSGDPINAFFVTPNNDLYVAYPDRVEKNGVRIFGVPNQVNEAPNQTSAPDNIFVDRLGNLFLSDRYSRVLKIAPGTTIGTVVAGGNDYGWDLNQLVNVGGIHVDSLGILYVAEWETFINLRGRVLKFMPGSSIGIVATGNLNTMSGMDVDRSGNIYTAAVTKDIVEKWVPGATNSIVVAGGTISGSGSNQLYAPYDVKLDENGKIYILDFGNARVQKY